MEKAYKLLALQEGLSNKQAKELIDAGRVSIKGEKLELARTLLKSSSKFKIKKLQNSIKIFEDAKIIAVDKAAGVLSSELESEFKARLLNRLDKDTSGVIMLTKDAEFAKLAIEEYKNNRVYKCYLAVLSGVVAEEIEINEAILKKNNFSKISKKGKSAYTKIIPLLVEGKKSLVKIEINTGRTHQIRVHTNHVRHGVIGDMKYAKIKGERMFLHSLESKIFDYDFKAPIRGLFAGFDLRDLDI